MLHIPGQGSMEVWSCSPVSSGRELVAQYCASAAAGYNLQVDLCHLFLPFLPFSMHRCFALQCPGLVVPADLWLVSERVALCSMLKWEGPLTTFKERLSSGEDVFGQLLDKFLLNNNHRVTVVTLPDSELAKQVEAQENERVITARSQMSADEVPPRSRLSPLPAALQSFLLIHKYMFSSSIILKRLAVSDRRQISRTCRS